MARAIAIRRTTGADPEFIGLTRLLDAELWDRYGEIQAAYEIHNDFIAETAAIALEGTTPVGCGCFKRYDATAVELKRMYVVADRRGRGVGRALMRELERWTIELGYRAVVLETGFRQPEAIELYESCGYTVIDNFGPYVDLENSICLRKQLR